LRAQSLRDVNYQVTRHQVLDLDLIELRGSFTSEDLYSAVGREQFVCTFAFRDGSDAQKALG